MSIRDSIVGLRLYDDNEELIVNDNWWDQRGFRQSIEICTDSFYEADLKEWVTMPVPCGEEIIGLRWSKDDIGDIKKLGLILWKSQTKLEQDQ